MRRKRCNPQGRSRGLQPLGRWLKAAGVAVVLLGLVRGFMVDAFRIPTSSMAGTLLAGDFMLVNKAAYGASLLGSRVRLPFLHGPARGDVIIFHPPHSQDRYYVKRVIGLPGDTLSMKEGLVVVNGRPLYEGYVTHRGVRRDGYHPSMDWQEEYRLEGGPRPTRDNWGPLLVPEERYFVLGDNRENSEDSRYWGFVDGDRILGQPWLVYYSRRLARGTDPWLRQVRWERIGDLVE